MEEQNIATIEASLAEAKQAAEDAGGEDEALNTKVTEIETSLTEAKTEAELQDDPVKKELEKVKKKGLTKLERLKFTKDKINQQIVDEEKEAGIESEENDDDKPVTKGELKEIQKGKDKKKALDLADKIEVESERDLTKHYLENKIVPSGNPEEDVKNARALVNSLKNSQIATELDRKNNPSDHSSGNGAPAHIEEVFEPTPDEQEIMKHYGLSEDDVKKARKKSQEEQG